MIRFFRRHFKYLFYFRDIDNVGDLVSIFLVTYLSGFEMIYKNPRYSLSIKKIIKWIFGREPHFSDYIFPFQKCLIALGSLLDYSNKRCVIWGTGFREYNSIWHGGHVYAVRGYLSRKKLPNRYRNVAIGDPALLLPLLMPIDRKSCCERNKIGIIPHYRDYDDLNKRFSNRYVIIDVKTKDIAAFIKQIVSCDYILSSSLHGLIISHSYGIPALWITNNYIDSGPFKFHDYFSSVDIPFYDGFNNIDEILKNEDSYTSLFKRCSEYSLPHANISEIQYNLLVSFPCYLHDRKKLKKYSHIMKRQV